MASSSSQTDGSTAEKSKRNREIPIHDISESDQASKRLKTEDAVERRQTECNQNFALSMKNRVICIDRISKSLEATGCIQLGDLLVEQSWLEALPGEFQKPYVHNLCMFLENEYYVWKKTVYPPPHLIFNALNTTPFHSVKVVILGEEPYLEADQAMGLSFSVPEEARVPSILRNVLKELEQDVGCCWVPSHGNLEKWALQGVLLLNILLTGSLSEVDTNSHAKIGWAWEQFTDAVIKTISKKKEGVVFLLWGKSAQEKIRIIDETKHHILKAAHPSEKGFFGCKHFSKTNQLLEQKGIYPIDWKL